MEKARPMVGGIFSNSALSDCPARISAGITTSAVSFPASPILRSSPTLAPNSRASASARVGMFSSTERSSSPCRRPEASAWPSCMTVAEVSAVLAPAMIPACCTVRTRAST